jgi:hypothetical protein
VVIALRSDAPNFRRRRPHTGPVSLGPGGIGDPQAWIGLATRTAVQANPRGRPKEGRE